MRISETNKINNDAMSGYAVPPLETAGTVVLMLLTDTIASLAATFGWSSFGFSSFGLSSGSASSGLSSVGYSSSVGTGIDGSLTVSEMVGRLGI